MVRGVVAGIGLALGLWACSPSSAFHCSTDSDCSGLPMGKCQPDGYCSTPDPDCKSMYRYGDHVGPGLAGKCVPATGGSSGSSTGGGATSVASGPSTGAGTTTSATSTSTSGGGTTSSTTGPGSTTDTGAPVIPYGQSCTSDSRCGDGFCYAIPTFGGYCGECKVDTDCSMGGCTMPNPNAAPPTGSVCNTGQLGDGCQTDAVCAPGSPHCDTLLQIGNFQFAACSSCASDTDCPGDTVCSPTIEIQQFVGFASCVSQGSLSVGETCDFAGSGDLACASGICSEVSYMNLLALGVCSECNTTADCAMGQTCQPGSLGAGLVLNPGTCM